MRLRTPLTELVGIEHPVVQTGMGWVAGARLVSATANAGGLCILASATMTLDELATAIGKVKAASPDAVFIYLNEDESARILKEMRRQDVKAPLVGETTLTGQKVIELAGDAANGALGHVGLTTDAPVPAIQWPILAHHS